MFSYTFIRKHRSVRSIVLGLLTLASVHLVSAQETEAIAENENTDVVAETTSVEDLVAVCVACHGEDGNATIEGYPNLAGQNAKYLLHQMELMRSGERQIPLMLGQLEQRTDEELESIANYYAGLPGRIGQASPDLLDLGERIYRGGLMAKEVAACTSCHSPYGNGNALAGFPRLSGQPVSYTVEALRQYREGERASDENNGGMMRDIAARLTDTEIRAVANYISGLY